MDPEQFGKLIRQLRESKHFTQSSLAEGICAREHIYRIEKGKYLPNAYLIQLLSLKLGEDLTQYMHLSNYKNPYETKKTLAELEELFYKRDYNALDKALKKAEGNDDFKLKLNKQLILWYKGILIYEKSRDYRKSMEVFLTALHLTKNFENVIELSNKFCIPQEIKILNSIVKLYIEQKNHKVPLILLRNIIKNLETCYQQIEIPLYSRMLYNLAKLLYRTDKKNEALIILEKGIEVCKKNHTFLILPDLYYEKGIILADFGKKELAIQCFRYFFDLYEILGQDNFIERTKRRLLNDYDIDFT